MRLACLAILSAIATIVQGGAVKLNTESPPQVYTNYDGTLCPYKADIALLIDASSSISPDDYETIKDFLKGVVSHFDIGFDKVRISAITFNNEAKVEFYLTSFTTKAGVLTAFDRFQGRRMGTLTHRALKFARLMLFTEENGDRPDVPNIVILVTDGRSSNKTKTAMEQALLKETRARIFAIGIGWIDEKEMRAVASDPVEKYYHYVKSFDGLQAILTNFKQDACAEITRPFPTTQASTTTPTTTQKPTQPVTQKPVTVTSTSPPSPETKPPVTDTCLPEAYVTFVLDTSSSVGTEELQREKEFVEEILNEFDIGLRSVRVAVVTFHMTSRIELNFGRHTTRNDVMSALNVITETHFGTSTHKALASVRSEVFGTLSDRPGVKNIVIVVTDGRSRKPELTKVEAEALKATRAVVFAIGVGSVLPEEIDVISSDPEQYSFYVDSFDALAAIKDQVVNKTCDSSPHN